MNEDKEFVTYVQALALKELGFDEPCLGWFMKINPLGKEFLPSVRFEKSLNQAECSIYGDKNCLAPLKQQVFRWFREKHNYISHIEMSGDKFFWCLLWREDLKKFNAINRCVTYEEAESVCIDKLITIVKK
jgi:hypothetical protein